ncbi:MAG: hypothetical protein D3903_01770 [Candidatus Electrothrix sp. GM3_4]|nr:hypothetical protein [Candidatus Electrothrix sp. GM3_4]
MEKSLFGKKVKDKLANIFFPKKGEKESDLGKVTESEELFKKFFLSDLTFTFLPLIIVIILKYSSGESGDIFLLPDWSFVSIIISSLTLIRFIELKVVYQKDTSGRSVVLAMVSIVLVIFSVLSLTLHTMKAYVDKINIEFILIFQFVVLAVSVILLYCSHRYRERLCFERREFPKNISANEFDWYLSENLKDARKSIQVTCAALNKDYDFFSGQEDIDNITEYEKQEMIRLIENMQEQLDNVHKQMKGWDKPPYST